MEFVQTGFETLLRYPTLLQLIGIVGFITYVIGFGLVQHEKICGNGIGYPASKVFAALCVLVSLVGAFNLASCLIQLSYIVIGLYGIAVRRKKARPGGTAHAETTLASPSQNIVILAGASGQRMPEAGLDRCG
ncbi:MAG: hypothetical protein OIF47_15165 [Marinibacterium sp.]|nr:hypothetical protein [Marinibacterium sp.]